jgi:serine/threonine protein kinase
VATPEKAILIDTCVLLDDPGVISRIRNRGGVPFLTSTVLDEVDFNKKGDEAINRNARRIFRELNKVPTAKLVSLPSVESLQAGDTITRFNFEEGPVFVIGRDQFRSRSNNDGKIIELAKQYGMLLLTRDNGMKARADAMSVPVVLWTGPQPAAQTTDNRPRPGPQQRKPGGATPRRVQPFALPSSPTTERDQPTPVSKLPTEGDRVILGSGRSIQLGPSISAGGEGRIYHSTENGMVCKIYHADKLTLLRQKKIQLMVSRKIDQPGICWPVDIVKNERGEFVGYVMPRAMGKTLQSSMFVKPVLEKTYPHWGRADLVKLCQAFLQHMQFLHSANIIVGDINPMNFLVTEDSSNLWMVDTDSFQIENFPCPVGTVNFTAPEIQGRNYSDFLRTKDHELFAVATMLFMLLHPGKPPYSQQGGGSPTDNIKAMDFPYRFRKNDDDYDGKNAPHGPWQMIWANLPFQMREQFHLAFRENRRLSIDEWLRALKKYDYMLSKGQTSPDLFPTSFRVRDPVDVPCGKCGNIYTASQQWVAKLSGNGKQPWCPECVKRNKLERLARDSARETRQAVQQNTTAKPARTTRTASAGMPPQSRPPFRPANSSSLPPQRHPYGSPSARPSQPSGGIGLVEMILKLIFK